MKKLIAGMLVVLSGCATVPLTDQEAAVRILRRSDAPASCHELGKVWASSFVSLTPDGRELDLKRKTAALGGDTVTIDRTDENLSVYGTAFVCASEARR